MKLFVSFFWKLLLARFKQRIAFLDESVMPGRVMPTDVDVFAHMNNAAYFAAMDLARIEHAALSGFAWPIFKNEWGLVVSAERVRFRKGLKLFQPFEVRTRVLGWEGKYRFIQHEFWSKGRLTAEAVVKEAFVTAKGKSVNVADALAIAGIEARSPAVPEAVQKWLSTDDDSPGAAERERPVATTN